MSRGANKVRNSRGSGQVSVEARGREHAHHCAFPSCAASSPPFLDVFQPAKAMMYKWSLSWSCVVVVVKLVAVVADVGWMSGAGPPPSPVWSRGSRKVTLPLDMARPSGAGRCSRAVPVRSCFHWAAGPT